MSTDRTTQLAVFLAGIQGGVLALSEAGVANPPVADAKVYADSLGLYVLFSNATLKLIATNP